MVKPLTEVQLRLYKLIVEYYREKRIYPPLSYLRDQMGYRTRHACWCAIKAITTKGYADKVPKRISASGYIIPGIESRSEEILSTIMLGLESGDDQKIQSAINKWRLGRRTLGFKPGESRPERLRAAFRATQGDLGSPDEGQDDPVSEDQDRG